MLFDASTYLLRIYVLFELFMLALLRITALHCVSSSFEQSHQLKHK
jgi:hypothetical protein